MKTILTAFLIAIFAHSASAAQSAQPNILLITAEDISPHLGCYGDANAVTPHLDTFAAQGVRFNNCYSVHPCCSPSRSALATGVYPTRLGTFQHRAEMWVNPTLVKCFPTLLREAGYYTFNGSQGGTAKLDYEFKPKDQPWSKIGSNGIEWRSRAPGQPFFGQINLFCTHQSQYGQRMPGRKTVDPGCYSVPPADIVHHPANITVPPYLPDTPAMREIWAEYHDRITQMDGYFATLLKMLADDGLADDTLVFFIGDNGHGMPGGKAWIWDQGPHVPLLVRIPKKWAHLTPHAKPGTTTNRLVSFVDFAPTMLSLAGVEIPGYMQGVAFLGPMAGEPRRYVHAARDFHDNADFDTSRMVRDDRFYYIRNFMPQVGWDAIQYSWQKAPYMLEEWRQLAQAGKLAASIRPSCFFHMSKPVEELYDMQTDPWQLHNLAADQQHQATRERLRVECERWMMENRDLGLLSQYELYTRSTKDSPLEMGMDPKRNPLRQLLDAANLANQRDPSAIPRLCELLQADDSAVRRWSAIGLLALGAKAAPSTATLLSALKDSAPDVSMTAAEALCGLGRADEAVPVLIALLSHKDYIIRHETILALCRIGPVAQAALPHLDEARTPGAEHSEGLWSFDNVVRDIPLARACLGATPDTPCKTRQRYIP
ncbi:MAG: sulfatase-like hydrolase/transferase [Verrucomicrobia bacterium]|nr:sulfatase-like hydrolase/transferase [Verrucomicrobiota bacterium]